MSSDSSKSRKFCSVPGCGFRGNKMFTFPKDVETRNEWVKACKITRSVTQTMYVCFRHFAPEDLMKSSKGVSRIRKGASPSVSLPVSTPSKALKMRRRCVVKGCGAADNMTSLELHNFPRNRSRRMHWQLLCRLVKIPTRNTCHQHFLTSDFIQKGASKILKRTAKPSRRLPDQDVASEDESSSLIPVSRPLRAVSQTTALEASIAQERSLLCEDHYCLLLQQLENDREKMNCLNEVVESLRNNDFKSPFTGVQSFKMSDPSRVLGMTCVGSQTGQFSVLSLITDDLQLRSFAGISFSLLESLTSSVGGLCHIIGGPGLSLKERIVLTLCKLRLNISFSCLNVLFGCDKCQSALYFYQILPLLSSVLKCAVYWPSKDEVMMNMPDCFSNFRDTRIVLQCLEIPVQLPECSKCCRHLLSQQNASSAVKIMIGTSPNGLITYVSNVHGAGAPDKDVFGSSDLLSRRFIDPFLDAVMADREFLIDDACEERFIRIYRPFHVSALCVQSQSGAATLNVYVWYGSFQASKVFKILQDKLDSQMIPFVNDMVTVAAGITNLGRQT